MNFFFEEDYREIIRHYTRLQPKKGRGQISKLSHHLGVNSTLVSQVLSGTRKLTEDQAYGVTEYFSFGQNQSYYFILLVQIERSGSPKFRNVLYRQIERLRLEVAELKGRVDPAKKLSFEEQAVFYSHWAYSAVRNLVAIEDENNIYKISERLGLSSSFVGTVVDQLLKYGLIVEEGGRLLKGPSSTYVPPESPLSIRHHQNWRQLSAHKVTQRKKSDFYFTAPLTISQLDRERIRQKIIDLVDETYKIVSESPSEEFLCLNIDLFEV